MVRLLLALSIAGLAAGAHASEAYRYEDNVAEFLATGKRALDAGKLDDARIELENVLLVMPGNPEAHELLVKTYVKQGDAGLARRTLDRIVEGRLLPTGTIEELRKTIPGQGGDGSAVRGGLWDGAPPPLPPPGAASPERSRLPTAAELAALERPTLEGDDLEGLLDVLEEGGDDEPPPVELPEVPIGGPAVPPPPPSGSDPRVLFEYAVGVFESTGRVEKVALLFVNAVDRAPELLGERDGGLLDATYRTYRERVEARPKDIQSRFVLAVLEERRGEDKEALRHWERLAKDAPAGNRFGEVGEVRARQVREDIARKETQRAAIEAQLEKEKLERLLPGIEAGKHPDVKDPADFASRGLEIYREWQANKDAFQLRVARAWLKGALVLKPDDPEYHYRFALIRIDEATEGEGDRAGARKDARAALEKALELDPPEKIKADAENLLKSLPAEQ